VKEKKELTSEDVFTFIQDKVDKKESYNKIKDELSLKKVPYNLVEEAFIKLTKVYYLYKYIFFSCKKKNSKEKCKPKKKLIKKVGEINHK
jgi:hypothetical protein